MWLMVSANAMTLGHIILGRFYKQIEGKVLGSLNSPMVANLYMKDFEIKAIRIAENPQECGKDMWMTLLWFRIQHIRRKSWNTSIPTITTSCSLLKKQDQIVLCNS